MPLTNQDKIRFIFRKHPETKFSRAEFWWKVVKTLYDIPEELKPKLIPFFKDWSGIDRALRFVLKEKEFQLPPENEARRYEKASQMREKYRSEDDKAKEISEMCR